MTERALSENYIASLPSKDGLPESSQKRIDTVVTKVLDVLDKRQELREQFQRDFRDMYLGALSNPLLLERLLDGIETRMIDALKEIDAEYDAKKIDNTEALSKWKEIITRYTTEALTVFRDSLTHEKKERP